MEITEINSGSDRMEMLGYEILSIISEGRTETVDNIIHHLEDGDIVHYLIETYKDDMHLINENSVYNLEDWNKIFSEYSYISFNSDVRRKMCLYNEENDGLLVLLNIIFQEISSRTYKL